jgi:hypothetical protein
MNATHPLDTLMPPGRRRDDSEKPQSGAKPLLPLGKRERKNYVLAFDNRHAFRDDTRGVVPLRSK